jgi:hypothetical protein
MGPRFDIEDIGGTVRVTFALWPNIKFSIFSPYQVFKIAPIRLCIISEIKDQVPLTHMYMSDFGSRTEKSRFMLLD